MKRKHYPLLTILGAVLLTSLPLALLLACSGQQNPEDPLAELTSPAPEASAGAIVASAQRGGIPELIEPRTDPAVPETPVKPSAADTHAETSPRPVLAEASPLITTPPISPVRESPVGTSLTFNNAAADSVIVDPVPVVTPDSASPGVIIKSDEGFSEAMAAITDVPGSMGPKPNHYQSTGHLALLNSSLVSEPMDNASMAEQPVPAEQGSSAENSAVSEKSREGRGPRSRTDRQASADKSSPSATGSSRKTRETGDADADKQALIEEVLIQTPVENSSVSRVENLVASTRAKGWPIALIRSDLPDDVWWVQQVIGIQGNSFAARVNFGNEYSLSGSVYRMVIVFLDTPDEVRRFRIAKQFKEIPEGTRRSREFHYIRQ